MISWRIQHRGYGFNVEDLERPQRRQKTPTSPSFGQHDMEEQVQKIGYDLLKSIILTKKIRGQKTASSKARRDQVGEVPSWRSTCKENKKRRIFNSIIGPMNI